MHPRASLSSTLTPIRRPYPHILLGHLSSSILLKCPYHINCLAALLCQQSCRQTSLQLVYSYSTLNPVGTACGRHTNNICVTQLASLDPVNPRLLQPTPDRRIILDFDFGLYTNHELFKSGTYKPYLQFTSNDYLCSPVNYILDIISQSTLEKLSEKSRRTICKNYQLKPAVRLNAVAIVNRITNTHPASPLLTQMSDIEPGQFCQRGPNGYSECAKKRCECIHLLQVPLDAVVEMVFADTAMIPGDVSHPFHVHGHAFHVVRLANFPAKARGALGVRFLKQGDLGAFKRSPRKSQEWAGGPRRKRSTNETVGESARQFNSSRREREDRQGRTPWFPAKDTVVVPAAGYAVVRFIANNPGYWLIHCHITYHQIIGMNLIMQVGNVADMQQPPPGFPKCGNNVNNVDISQYA